MRPSGSRAQVRRDQRWPPLNSITPEGRLAGFVTTGSLVVSGIVWIAFSVRALVHSDAHYVESSVGGLLTILLSILVAVLIGVARRVSDRPVEPDGSSGWLYGLSLIFLLGVAAAVTRIRGRSGRC